MQQLKLILLLVLLPLSAAAIDESEILDYDEAFVLSAQALDSQSVEIRWDIKPQHYMYTRFLEVSTETPGAILGEMIIPPGEEKFDELLGEKVVTFHDQLVVTVPVVERGDNRLVLNVRSQGCLENVLCYPPTFQQVTVELPPGEPSPGGYLDTLAAPTQGIDMLGLQEDQALAPENAFVYEAVALNAGTILVRFTPAPGYYLYRDKFVFSIDGAPGFSVRDGVLPPGTIKDDPEFGDVEVYFGQVEIPVRFNRPAGPEQRIILSADFQGCRDGDICYPPDQRSLEVLVPAAASAIGDPGATPAERRTVASSVPVTEQDRLAGLLISNPGKAMLAFFGLGILLAFTPCVFPMVPILSGIIAGQGPDVTTRKAFTLSLVYVVAMALTYTVAGVIAGLFGKNLQAVFQDPWIISSFAGLFVLLSLSMFGFYELQLPASWQGKLAEISGRREGGNMLGVGIMGFLSALIVGPCVAPPLAAALIVIGGSGDAGLGGGALFSMAMGMGLPLIVVGTSAGRLLPRAGAWMNAIKAVFGVGLLALAIWMLERILDGWIIMLLWGALAIGSGIYMGALDRLQRGVSGWQRLWKTLGLALVLIGAAEIVGALSGGDDWQRPLHHFRGGADGEAASVRFTRIKTTDELEAALIIAAADGESVMLDFYADWCVECKRMEKTTFRDARVIDVLAHTTLLQADVTAFDDEDEALVNRFSLYGPPAILFFDQNGKERPGVRMIGYMDAEEFLAHLEIALGQP